jgi:hypothetical protein
MDSVVPRTDETIDITLERHPKAPKGINHARTIELYKKGLGAKTIAKVQGCSAPNITKFLQRHGLHRERLNAWKEWKADILAAKQEMLVSHITPAKAGKMGIRDLAVSMGILHDKEQDQRHGRTPEVQVNILNLEREAINARREQLLAHLEKLNANSLQSGDK